MKKLLFLLFLAYGAFAQENGTTGTVKFPASKGNSGKVLSTDGTKLIWITPSGSGATTTTGISEGTNLYFTNPRVIAAPLTGFVSSTSNTPISATDNLLQAIQKLDGSKSFAKTHSASANYTLLSSDEFIAVTTSGITLNLLDPSINEGKKVSIIMQVEGSVNFNYPIYRTRNGSGVINTTVIATDGSAGTNWAWNSVDLVVINGQYWLY